MNTVYTVYTDIIDVLKVAYSRRDYGGGGHNMQR